MLADWAVNSLAYKSAKIPKCDQSMKLLALLSLLAISATAWRATVYKYSHHKGDAHTAADYSYGCYSLPRSWWDVASSIKTHDTCVAIYEVSLTYS